MDNSCIAALKCCKFQTCSECPYQPYARCRELLVDRIIEFVSDLQAANDELQARTGDVIIIRDAHNGKIVEQGHIKYLSVAEIELNAKKEFAEQLSQSILKQLTASTLEKSEAYHFCLNEIDTLVDK